MQFAIKSLDHIFVLLKANNYWQASLTVHKKPGCILMLIRHIDFREQKKKTNYIKSVHLVQIERFEVSAGNA